MLASTVELESISVIRAVKAFVAGDLVTQKDDAQLRQLLEIT
jgi:hypothetical protein